MLDAADEVAQLRSSAARKEQHDGAVEGRVADPFDALRAHVGQEADGDGVLDVDGVGEATGEQDPVDLLWVEPQPAQQDALPGGVGGLGLGQLAGVRA